jgi:hypothetical protein
VLQGNITLVERMARYKIIRLIEAHKDEVTRLVEGQGGTVQWNPYMKHGSPVYDRFMKAGSGLLFTPDEYMAMFHGESLIKPNTTTKIAFHGTGKQHIGSILQHGMDPNKRTSSSLYDWYGTHLHQIYVRQRGGNNIVVFALLVDPQVDGGSGFAEIKTDVLVGTKSDHALPLGVISLVT